jgi:hypothetical protein
MSNLHFLLLDGCDVRCDFGTISKELQCLQWRHMPLTHLPAKLDLSNLVSFDLSYSTMLANLWAKSNSRLWICVVGSSFEFGFARIEKIILLCIFE